MFEIRLATEPEFSEIRSFYYAVIDSMESAQYKPAWKKGVYPADAYLLRSIQNQELYIGKWNHSLAAAMIVNHESNEGYNGVNWSVDAGANETMIIHALCVHPDFAGKGLAKRMVEQVISIARKNRQRPFVWMF